MQKWVIRLSDNTFSIFLCRTNNFTILDKPATWWLYLKHLVCTILGKFCLDLPSNQTPMPFSTCSSNSALCPPSLPPYFHKLFIFCLCCTVQENHLILSQTLQWLGAPHGTHGAHKYRVWAQYWLATSGHAIKPPAHTYCYTFALESLLFNQNHLCLGSLFTQKEPWAKFFKKMISVITVRTISKSL